MKKLVLFSVVAFLCLGLYCAPGEIQNEDQGETDPKIGVTYGGSGNDEGGKIVKLKDGKYVIFGYTESQATGQDFYLLKISSSGELLWEKKYGGPANDLGLDMTPTSDGGFIMVGATRSYGKGEQDIWVVKVDGQGDKVWSKTYGGSGSDVAMGVDTTSDGGFVITGRSDSNPEKDLKILLMKIDGQGRELWEKSYDAGEWGQKVRQTEDHGYIIAGGSWDRGNDQLILVKTSSEGVLEWSKEFGGSASEDAHSIRITNSQGYIITGRTGSYGAGGTDIYLIKTNKSGVLQWKKTFGGSGNDSAQDIILLSGGGYLLTGNSNSFAPSKGYEVYLVKINAKGEEVWSSTFGSKSDDNGGAAVELQNGEFAVVGGTSSSSSGSKDIYFLKVDQNGQVIQ